MLKRIMMFFEEQRLAEQEGRETFVCPVCGGRAWWRRAHCNGHLHMGCEGCGFKLME